MDLIKSEVPQKKHKKRKDNFDQLTDINVSKRKNLYFIPKWKMSGAP